MTFSVCNPVIISKTADLEGRWEVWCRRCGSWYADTMGEARLLQNSHMPKPVFEPTEATTDWSESVKSPQ